MVSYHPGGIRPVAPTRTVQEALRHLNPDEDVITPLINVRCVGAANDSSANLSRG